MRKHRKLSDRTAAGPAGLSVPTKPTKAYVAAVVVLAGLVGIHLTNGTAQALVMLGQLLFTVYGVWRATNRPKLPDRGRGVQGFLQ